MLHGEYFGALWRYLREPKTVFDFKDRSRALLLFVFAVVVLQWLVRKLPF